MRIRIKSFIKWILAGKSAKHLKGAPLAVIFTNFIFQRIFRINSHAPENIHFTSSFGEFKNIRYYTDNNTLTSFCVSGGCYFQSINGILIGRNFLFAPGVKLISANHSRENRKVWDQTAPIKIGNNVWLGANVTILPGVEIADGCIVGAGSVVTKSILKPNAVAVGNPAKLID